MRFRLPLLVLLLMVRSCGPACGVLRAQTFDLTKHAEPLADLSGAKWRFHPGDDPHWADPGFDDSQWPLLSGHASWDSQGYKGLTGFGWYRIHVTLPPAQPVAFAGVMCNNYEAFADGRKIGAWGPVGPGSIPMFDQFAWSTAAPVPQHGGEVVLALRVWLSPSRWCQDGGFSGYPILLGSPAEIGKEISLDKSARLIRNSAECMIGLLYILGGCFALLLYRKGSNSKEYLWFGIFGVAAGIYPISFLAFDNWLYVSIRWNNLTDSLAGDVPHIALILFFFYFIGQPVARFARWLIYILAGLMLFDLAESAAVLFISFTAWSAIDVVSDAVCYATVVWLAFAYWKQSRSARRLAVPLLLLGTANIASDASQVPYFAGLTAHLLPPILTNPVSFTYADLAYVLFLGAVAYILIERFAETQAERTRLHGEFEAARTVQQVLIPDFLEPVPGLTVESAYLPAQEVGGDFFQVLPIADGAAFVIVGDVSGKGLKAAMTVSLIVGTLRTYAEFYTSPAELLAGMNRRLHGRTAGFATCLALMITREGEVAIANAGHPNPYLDGMEIETDSNLPLGITLDVEYAETRLHIDPAQRLTLVTDGVVEATAAATKELFGFDRTQAVSRQAANAIAEAARAFGLGAPQADDITVLTVARTPVMMGTAA
jgi:hypothetical protein